MVFEKDDDVNPNLEGWIGAADFSQKQLLQLRNVMRSVVREALEENMQHMEELLSRRQAVPGPTRAWRAKDAECNSNGAHEQATCKDAEDVAPAEAPSASSSQEYPTTVGSKELDETEKAGPPLKYMLKEHCMPGADQLKVLPSTQGLNPGDYILITGSMTESKTRRYERHRIASIVDGETLMLGSVLEQSYRAWSEVNKQVGKPAFREWVAGFVHTHRFDAVMGFFIMINSATIGLGTQLRLESPDNIPKYLFFLESLFLGMFLIELILRLIADGAINFKNGWFWFDATLVFTGVISNWIIEPIIEATGAHDVLVISQLLTLRVLRLMRLVRALRTMEYFQELWKLCSGLMKSARTMLSVCLLVVVAIYPYACVGVDLINNSTKLAENQETRAIVEAHFSSLGDAVLTLMSFANADSIAGIYFPICKEEPLLVLFFLPLWLVVTVALMNLVTAIIVENAMAKGKEDADERDSLMRKTLKKVFPQMSKLFMDLDQDKSGSLTLREIQQKTDLGLLKMPAEIEAFVTPDKLLDVFEFLDADQSGEIDEQEFTDGIVSLALSSVPIETTQMLQLLRSIHQVMLELKENAQHERSPLPG